MLSITDNGIGFTEDQFRSFLAPNVSFKRQENRGNKGVGASYLAYGFNFLQIGTKNPNYEFIGSLKDGREWVEDETGTVSRPKVTEDTEPLHDIFQNIDQGATFTLKLIGQYIRPSRLNWLGASTAEQWQAILRIKTPLGGIYIESEQPRIACDLSVIDESGIETTLGFNECEYLYPHKVIGASVDLQQIRLAQQKLLKRGIDVSKLPAKFFKLNGIFCYWNTDAFVTQGGEFSERLSEE